MVLRDLVTQEFLILTVFPNWQGYIPDVGDIGFLEFEFVEEGTSEYYDSVTKKKEVYKGTHFFFKKFVKEEAKNQKDILL